MDFLSPTKPQGNRTGERYIIITTYYFTRWDEDSPIKYRSDMTIMKFLFENVVTIFGCPQILLSDQGMHFLSKIIESREKSLLTQNKRWPMP